MKFPIQVEQKNCLNCAFKGHSLFSILSDDSLDHLNAHKSCTIFKKGQYLFTQHSRPMGLFCVYSGKIKLSTAGPDGKEQIIRLAKDGDVIGYRAIITDENYRLSAIALEESSVCLIEKEFFLDLAMSEPRLNRQIFKLISDDLKRAEEQIVSLSQKSVRERTAEALLFLKATYGFEDDNQTLNIRLSREELADYVGTTTESVIRVLSDFKTSGLIDIAARIIIIIDLGLLIKTANMIP